MTDPTATPPPDEPQASPAPDPGPSAAPPDDTGKQGDSDHHGIIVFFGVLALILLLVGAVGAGLSSGSAGSGSGSDDDGSIGQRRRLEQQERRVERRAAWLERHVARLQRRAERLEQRAERRAERERERQQGGQSDDDDEDAVMTEATGTVVAQTEADGSTTFVLETVAGPLVLDVGPERYWAGNNPLIPLVGQTTTVRGLQEPGDDEIEVFVVGDQVIRGQGPPPWAGGGKPGSTSAADPSASPGTSPGPSASP